jgi:hypothetical protein
MNKATGYGIAALVMLFVFAAANHCFAGPTSYNDFEQSNTVMQQQLTEFTSVGTEYKQNAVVKQPELPPDQQRIKEIFGEVYDTNRTQWETPYIPGGSKDGIQSAVDIKYFDNNGKLIGVERVVNKVVDGKNKQITYFFDPDFNIVETTVADIPKLPPSLRPEMGTWQANKVNR